MLFQRLPKVYPHSLLMILLLPTMFGLAACKRNRPVVTPPPTVSPAGPATSPAADPAPAATPPVMSALDVADQYFSAGQYEEAAKRYESLLQEGSAEVSPSVLIYRLALSRLLQGPAGRDGVVQLLVEFLRQDPASENAAEARVLVSLLEELRQVSDRLKERQRVADRLARELEKMKEIDLRKKP